MLYVKCKDGWCRSGIVITGSIAGVDNAWVIQARDDEGLLELGIRVFREQDVDWYVARCTSILRKVGWIGRVNSCVRIGQLYMSARAFPPEYIPLRRAAVVDLEPISELKWPKMAQIGVNWESKFCIREPSDRDLVLPNAE